MDGNAPKFTLVKFKTLVRDAHGPKAAVEEVLHSQDDLDEYLQTCQSPPNIKRPVDFPSEKVVAVALGDRPQGGYTVQVTAVVRETGGFVGIQHHILFVEHAPHGLSNDMVTYPHHMISVRELAGPVSFHQVPDTLGQALRMLAPAPGAKSAAPDLTTFVVGEEGPTQVTGESPTTFVTPTEEHPTTLAVGEEHTTTHFSPIEEGPTTLFSPTEEHPTTAMFGEETPTGIIAEGPTTQVSPIEEHPTTLVVGEEGPMGGGGVGPFG